MGSMEARSGKIAKIIDGMALTAMDSEPDCNERKLFCSTDTARMRKVVSASDGSGTTPLYHRAAMLRAGTLTNEDTKQAWTGIPDIDNAINMLDRIDTLESCDDDRIEAVKTVLRGLAGNSPVIPEGYVMVPKEPTSEMVKRCGIMLVVMTETSRMDTRPCSQPPRRR